MADTPAPRPTAGAAPAARPRIAPLEVMARLARRWWLRTIADVDQPGVIAKVKGESGLTARYVFMTCMSAGIAILGLLLSSPAVVIGAMLLSPLMSPIIGAGFALAIGDVDWLRDAVRALAVGVVVAVLFCTAIVLLSPLNTVTEEIAARTRPNLFDLMVALFSALAGAYAMIRGREGTIVGVAIATALMPPLAVVGFGLATRNWTVFGGSALLFFTNLMTIALTAAVMARLNGFRTDLSPRHTMLQTAGVLAAFLVLAVPLGVALQRIAWETNAARQANTVVAAAFAQEARVSALDFDFRASPIRLEASVLTPAFRDGAEAAVERALAERLGRNVDVRINQMRVGTGAGAAESAELAVARQEAQADNARERLQALAGMLAAEGADAVLIDREARRARVKAAVLPGAGLASYRTLERRLAAAAPGWRVALVPPLLALPPVPLEALAPNAQDGEGAEDAEALPPALALAGWAAVRTGIPLLVEGPEPEAGRAATLLRRLGARASLDSQAPAGAEVRLRWGSQVTADGAESAVSGEAGLP